MGFLLRLRQLKGVFSSRVERLLEKVIEPDAVFPIDNKPFILFFDSPKTKGKAQGNMEFQ